MSTPAPDAASGTAASYSDDLNLALNLANAADDLTMGRFEAGDLHIETKPDLTPVSDADTATETRLRELLSTHRPEDAVLGEEFGGDVELTGRQWVIDPIDGTKNFVRGVPVWATLISLLVDGEPVVGVVSAPGLARRWWAAEGMGAWRTFGTHQARRMNVSKVSDIADSSISLSSLDGWKVVGRREEIIALTDSAWRLRGFGDFWSYCMVAEGTVDIAAEPEVSLWDLAALDVIVREAGGTFTSLDGTPGPHEGSAVASNGLLQDAVLSALEPGDSSGN
ncbi:MAG TPA: histidinol-phosphatase [Candidatus Corynebacterium avicola]|uniref:Histidinol-phosphatase n=1 Tax=Candidatus Corynebacterium avicola TaxID=2838527 RepID=A0A9D1RME9_9CORY|nr:histidinol-phosphatase [Candidatus Corynebacterium avicola]